MASPFCQAKGACMWAVAQGRLKQDSPQEEWDVKKPLGSSAAIPHCPLPPQPVPHPGQLFSFSPLISPYQSQQGPGPQSKLLSLYSTALGALKVQLKGRIKLWVWGESRENVETQDNEEGNPSTPGDMREFEEPDDCSCAAEHSSVKYCTETRRGGCCCCSSCLAAFLLWKGPVFIKIRHKSLRDSLKPCSFVILNKSACVSCIHFKGKKKLQKEECRKQVIRSLFPKPTLHSHHLHFNHYFLKQILRGNETKWFRLVFKLPPQCLHALEKQPMNVGTSELYVSHNSGQDRKLGHSCPCCHCPSRQDRTGHLDIPAHAAHSSALNTALDQTCLPCLRLLRTLKALQPFPAQACWAAHRQTFCCKALEYFPIKFYKIVFEQLYLQTTTVTSRRNINLICYASTSLTTARPKKRLYNAGEIWI